MGATKVLSGLARKLQNNANVRFVSTASTSCSSSLTHVQSLMLMRQKSTSSYSMMHGRVLTQVGGDVILTKSIVNIDESNYFIFKSDLAKTTLAGPLPPPLSS